MNFSSLILIYTHFLIRYLCLEQIFLRFFVVVVEIVQVLRNLKLFKKLGLNIEADKVDFKARLETKT